VLVIKNRTDLQKAVALLLRYQSQQSKYNDLVSKYRGLVVGYLVRKNRKQYKDEDGNVWQKRQSTRIVYNYDALRALLRKKKVDPADVIVTQQVEVVNEEAILQLLKTKKLTVEEYEDVVSRHSTQPYIVKIDGSKKRKQEPSGVTEGRRRSISLGGANHTSRRA
jgi:hypothetical protein